MVSQVNFIQQAFTDKFSRIPMLSQAPGRINIIGEHTDYNDGYVLPGAIDFSVVFAGQLNNTNTCSLVALDLDDEYELNLEEELEPVKKGWVNFIIGVLAGFKAKGAELAGFDLMFTSDIPIGAGLSSSAAIESGLGVMIVELFKFPISKLDIALIGQKAEHEFVGVKCGIMDQFASTLGKQDHVLKIDCRTLEHEYFPANFGEYQLVLIDSAVKHALVDSEYNKRREQCEQGVKALRVIDTQITALRDATLDQLEIVKPGLADKVYDRCKYVVEENNRVLEVCNALSNNDINRVGELMNATHEGLSKLYEVSCPELDLLVDLSKEYESVIGSRMMGGGFGGCTINLIHQEHSEEIVNELLAKYKEQTGIETKAYFVNLSDGAHVIQN